MSYRLRGFGDTTAAVPAPSSGQVVVTRDAYGRTFWDFIDESSSLDFSGFLYRYRVVAGVGIALLIGSLMFFKQDKP